MKRPSIGRSLPELVAIEVTSMSRMRMAMASPISAPATATGVETSCPPRIDGVIIGPQHPGVVFTTMWPPSATGPAIRTSGPRRPSVKVSTKTVRWTWVVAVGGVCVAAMRGLLRFGYPPDTGVTSASSSPARSGRSRPA